MRPSLEQTVEQKVKSYGPNIPLIFFTLGLAFPWAKPSARFKRDAKKQAKKGWWVHSVSKLEFYGSLVVVYWRGGRYAA